MNHPCPYGEGSYALVSQRALKRASERLGFKSLPEKLITDNWLTIREKLEIITKLPNKGL